MRGFFGGLIVLAAIAACSSSGNSPLVDPGPGTPAGAPGNPTSSLIPLHGPSAGVSIVHRAAPLGNNRMTYAWSSGDTTNQPDLTVVTDPDHDSVWVIGASILGNLSSTRQIELAVGDEPGDIALGYRKTGNTRESIAYVSLHGGGAVLSIPLGTTDGQYARLPVCAQPRGIDTYPQADGQSYVYVACADGVLVTLDASTGTVVSTLPIADDLKDVVVIDGKTALLTQFRSANVLQVDLGTGAVAGEPLPGGPDLVADVAWQMVPVGSGYPRSGAVVVHQLASTAQIKVVANNRPPPPPGEIDAGFDPGFDGGSPDCVCICDNGQCSVDGAGDCDDGTNCLLGSCGQQTGYGPPTCSVPNGPPPCQVGVVAAAATVVRLSSTAGALPELEQVGMFSGMVPPLTVAIAQTQAQVPAGDPQAVVLGLGNGVAASFDVTSTAVNQASGPVACLFQGSFNPPQGVVAIAFPPQGNLLAPTFFARQQGGQSAAVVMGPQAIIDLPYQAISGEAGRELFHNATPSFMSCASCHPNGREDGHIWNFDPMGLRRTPALGGGLLQTAPFHWDGAERDISQLMTDVFVGRMEGEPPTSDQVTAISDWLNTIPAAQAHSAPDAAAVARGKALFESDSVGCTVCHSGDHFTNNQTLDVGTGGSFQVPSLLGVGSRAPYLHDGRATQLADRFGPGGGGDLHGHTSQLPPAQIDDLVAYLRSL